VIDCDFKIEILYNHSGMEQIRVQSPPLSTKVTIRGTVPPLPLAEYAAYCFIHLYCMAFRFQSSSNVAAVIFTLKYPCLYLPEIVFSQIPVKSDV
jgi:hypothetical protein